MNHPANFAGSASVLLSATLASLLSFAALAQQQGGNHAPTNRLAQVHPVHLSISQADAFGVIGHSCGGIAIHPYVTGFDPVSGYPSGAAYLSTNCSQGGIGGGTIHYTAWAGVTWDFSANVVNVTTLASAPAVDPAFYDSDVFEDTIYNSGNSAYLLVPVPGVPSGVSVVQSGDQFLLSWTPRAVNPAAVSSSVLSATPINSSAPLLVTNLDGSASNGSIPNLQPQTLYRVTVVNTSLGGSGPESVPIFVTTAAATIPPGIPPGVSAHWINPNPTGATDTLVASWLAADPGNSPIDQYEIHIIDQDNGSILAQSVPGSTLGASFVVDWNPDWDVTVRAHNAAGWGAWSNPITLGGL
jgi:hypothetical protein